MLVSDTPSFLEKISKTQNPLLLFKRGGPSNHVSVWLISSFTSEKSFEFFFLIFEQYNEAFYQSICIYNWFLQNIVSLLFEMFKMH